MLQVGSNILYIRTIDCYMDMQNQHDISLYFPSICFKQCSIQWREYFADCMAMGFTLHLNELYQGENQIIHCTFFSLPQLLFQCALGRKRRWIPTFTLFVSFLIFVPLLAFSHCTVEDIWGGRPLLIFFFFFTPVLRLYFRGRNTTRGGRPRYYFRIPFF